MDNISNIVGHTPTVLLPSFSRAAGARLYVKLEFYNPTGSLKDRIAVHMIDIAEKKGELLAGATLVESTSGNTGIAVASVARRRGYRTVICTPEYSSKERLDLIRALGAELVLTPAGEGQDGAIRRAQELGSRPGHYLVGQFSNPENPRAHYETTGAEILEQVPDLDTFVAGVGTGGTITGVARRFRDAGKRVRVVGVEAGPGSIIQGLHIRGALVPPVFEEELLDEFVVARDEEAVDMCRRVACQEGLFVGLSSGAVIAEMLRQAQSGRKCIVGIVADDSLKYISLGIFDERQTSCCGSQRKREKPCD